MANVSRPSNSHAPMTNATIASQSASCLGHQPELRVQSGASPTHGKEVNVAKQDEFDDEFDDDEDLMNGMLDLAAKYESQPKCTTNNENVSLDQNSCRQQSQKDPPGRLESLDEFEDAFDDDDELWDNIAKATPAGRTVDVGDTNNVRLE
jgi:hypothetical protein